MQTVIMSVIAETSTTRLKIVLSIYAKKPLDEKISMDMVVVEKLSKLLQSDLLNKVHQVVHLI